MLCTDQNKCYIGIPDSGQNCLESKWKPILQWSDRCWNVNFVFFKVIEKDSNKMVITAYKSEEAYWSSLLH